VLSDEHADWEEVVENAGRIKAITEYGRFNPDDFSTLRDLVRSVEKVVGPITIIEED
jgi:hypothetical protein